VYYLLYFFVIITTLWNEVLNDPPIYYHFQSRWIKIDSVESLISIDSYIFGIKYTSRKIEISEGFENKLSNGLLRLSQLKGDKYEYLDSDLPVIEVNVNFDLLLNIENNYPEYKLNTNIKNIKSDFSESLNVSIRYFDKEESIFDKHLVAPHYPNYFCRRDGFEKFDDFIFSCTLEKGLFLSGYETILRKFYK
jgi:hypothetical protein